VGSSGPRSVSFPPGRAWIDDEHGLVRVSWDQGSSVTVVEAKAQFEAMKSLVEGRRYPCLVDLRNVFEANREARQFYGKPQRAEVVSACAILVGASGVAAVIGNFILRFRGSALPTKLFTTEDEAVEWLKEFR
jgi:hypothetical protein